jgi:hypothetical protein
MKRLTTYTIMALAAFALVITSCGDKSEEKRIAELEARLAQLENTGGTTAVTPATPTAATPSPADTKPEGPIPSLEWSALEWDFGTINEGDVVEHAYTFKNTGQAPLIIESAKPSCGCTVPSWTKEPIPVGGTGEILVKFDSKGKPNIQNKTVTVTANTWPKVTTLRFKTFVTPTGK